MNFDAEISGDGFVRKANGASMLRTVNAEGLNYAPCISMDGLELFFTRSGSIYHVTRPDTSAAFGRPERVTAAQGFVEAPTLSGDGHLLYYHRLESGHFVLYLIRR